MKKICLLKRIEIEHAKIDGVKFNLYKSPLEFTEEGIKYINTKEDDTSEGFEEADSILVAISQTARDLIVRNNTGLSLGENGLLQSDENGKLQEMVVLRQEMWLQVHEL